MDWILGWFLPALKPKRRVRRRKSVKPLPRGFYLKHKEQARALVKERLEFFNAHYQFSYGRVAIKDQRTRWGSCSSKGNLNFSYRLVFLPAECVDYVIVHELCHLKEFNHSPRFWALVAQTIPNYKKLRAQIQKPGAGTLADQYVSRGVHRALA